MWNLRSAAVNILIDVGISEVAVCLTSAVVSWLTMHWSDPGSMWSSHLWWAAFHSFYFEGTSDSDTSVQIYSQCFHFWLCHSVEHNYRICCVPVISGIFCHAAAHLDQFLRSRKDPSQIMRKPETARIKSSPLLQFYFCGEQAGVGHDGFLSRRQSNRQLAFNMSLLAPDIWKYSGVWICKVGSKLYFLLITFPTHSTNYHHRI